jgi:1,4-dihydroxy-2-naphthoate octaprenyltransferase/general stress protein 26
MPYTKEDILRDLKDATEASVSTIAGEYVRSRMMHYAVTDDFTFYLSTMKGDPKVIHITHNPSINLMILRKVGDPAKFMDIGEFAKWREIEVQGKARMVKDRREREYALKLLSQRSPIVRLLCENKQEHVLDVIKVEPHVIRFKVVSDILQGKPPKVLEFVERRSSFEELKFLTNKIKTWYLAIRAPFLVASIPSTILGALIALKLKGVLDLWLFFLTLLGVIFAHISVNLLNDYFDHKLQTDIVNTEFIRPFSGGSRVLQLGLLTPLEVFSGSLLFLVTAVSIGVFLSLISGPLVLFIALLGFLSILAYNIPPIRLSGNGLGEFIVGINFGVLVTLGSFVVQTGVIEVEPIISSIPLAILVALILFINEFPDYNADKITGRKTLVVLLGRKRARWLYLSLICFTYLYIVIAVISSLLPIYAVITLITIPLTLYALKHLFRNYDSPFDMIPSYVSTIVSYISIGFLLVITYLMVSITSFTLLTISIAIIIIYIVYEYYQIRRDLKAFLTVKGMVKVV